MDRPLRFCMVTTFYPPYSFGGDAVFVQRLATELLTRGHHVEVIHCIDSFRLMGGRAPERVDPDRGAPSPLVHGLRSPIGFLSPLATHQTGLALGKRKRIRSILKRGFDVIHYHNVSLVGGPGVLALGSGIKLYTMHECWLVCPTHVLNKFRREPCDRPHCLLCTLAHRRPPQWWRYTNLLPSALRHVDAFIAPSRFSRDLHLGRGLDIPVVTIPNFVPAADKAPPQETAERTADPYFLFVGRLERIKGLHTVIPLFRKCRRAKLLIAGAGDDENWLRQLAAGDPNIRFLGHLGVGELNSLYRRATAVIVPSQIPEIFPLVILEAFRQRTPVLVRDLGGMPEIIEESGGGIIFSTSEELQSAMALLLENPAKRDRLGTRSFIAK